MVGLDQLYGVVRLETDNVVLYPVQQVVAKFILIVFFLLTASNYSSIVCELSRVEPTALLLVLIK